MTDELAAAKLALEVGARPVAAAARRLDRARERLLVRERRRHHRRGRHSPRRRRARARSREARRGGADLQLVRVSRRPGRWTRPCGWSRRSPVGATPSIRPRGVRRAPPSWCSSGSRAGTTRASRLRSRCPRRSMSMTRRADGSRCGSALTTAVAPKAGVAAIDEALPRLRANSSTVRPTLSETAAPRPRASRSCAGSTRRASLPKRRSRGPRGKDKRDQALALLLWILYLTGATPDDDLRRDIGAGIRSSVSRSCASHRRCAPTARRERAADLVAGRAAARRPTCRHPFCSRSRGSRSRRATTPRRRAGGQGGAVRLEHAHRADASLGEIGGLDRGELGPQARPRDRRLPERRPRADGQAGFRRARRRGRTLGTQTPTHGWLKHVVTSASPASCAFHHDVVDFDAYHCVAEAAMPAVGGQNRSRPPWRTSPQTAHGRAGREPTWSSRGSSLVGLLTVVVVLGILTGTAIVGVSTMSKSSGVRSVSRTTGAVTGSSAHTAGSAPSAGSACRATADAARSASALYFLNNGAGFVSGEILDMTTSTPPIYTLATNVFIDAGNPTELDGNGWRLVMSGGGVTAPTFTCS